MTLDNTPLTLKSQLSAIKAYFGMGAVLEVLKTRLELRFNPNLLRLLRPNNYILSGIIYQIIFDKPRHQSQTIDVLISYIAYLKASKFNLTLEK